MNREVLIGILAMTLIGTFFLGNPSKDFQPNSILHEHVLFIANAAVKTALPSINLKTFHAENAKSHMIRIKQRKPSSRIFSQGKIRWGLSHLTQMRCATSSITSLLIATDLIHPPA